MTAPAGSSRALFAEERLRTWRSIVEQNKELMHLTKKVKGKSKTIDISNPNDFAGILRAHSADDDIVQLIKDFEEACAHPEELEDQGAFDKYRSGIDGDPRWFPVVFGNVLAESVTSFWNTFSASGSKKELYIEATRKAFADKNKATFNFPRKPKGGYRIAIIGDAGTADDHQKRLIQAAASMNVDAMFHLGDIYYCGTPTECENFWLGYAEAFEELELPVPPMFSIPGNHEYISGGHGFFKNLLPHLGLPSARQRSSFFCVRFPGVQIIGLDTGVNTTYTEVAGAIRETGRKNSVGEPLENMSETTLEPVELDWLTRLLEEDPSYPTILLTHHQPRSPYFANPENESKLWRTQLKPLLAQNPQVKIWLWGHEHKLRIYRDDYLRGGMPPSHTVLGRCVGNACMPESVPDGDETKCYYYKDHSSIPTPNLKADMSEGVEYVNNSYALVDINEDGSFSIEYRRVNWNLQDNKDNNSVLHRDSFPAPPRSPAMLVAPAGRALPLPSAAALTGRRGPSARRAPAASAASAEPEPKPAVNKATRTRTRSGNTPVANEEPPAKHRKTRSAEQMAGLRAP